MSLHRLHDVAVRTCPHAEALGNLILVSVTGVHEWGNPVGLACVPLVLILCIRIVLVHE